MKRLATLAVLALGLALVAALAFPGGIEPAPFRPPRAPALEGPLAANAELRRIELLASGRLAGPEDVEVDARGRVYCGNEDGTIRRLEPAAGGVTVSVFAETGGRPLGLALDRQGTLWVADSARGLLAVAEAGRATVRLAAVGGVRLGYADGLDTAPDGRIYLSDASTRFGPEELHLEPLEARPWGRLVEYDPATNGARVLLDDLYFANGVAVSEDGAFVLVAETFRYRIRRYWLTGPRAGEDEVFADNLPGFPDGVARNGRGGFWVAIFSPRVALLDRILHPRPWLKRLVGRIPARHHPRPEAYGLVLSLGADGRYLGSLHDPGGRRYPYVTSIAEHDGNLYLASIEADAVARYPLEPVLAPADPAG